MEEWPGMSLEVLERYAEDNMLEVDRQIGFGIHGRVYALISPSTRLESAVKLFDDESGFERELAVYQRLQENEIQWLGKFSVPLLLDFDEAVPLIHMTIVQRPFCLDFASAYLDELPSYFPPFDENWHREKENQFGSEKWPEVLSVVRELESLGIFQTDVSPSNIAL